MYISLCGEMLLACCQVKKLYNVALLYKFINRNIYADLNILKEIYPDVTNHF